MSGWQQLVLNIGFPIVLFFAIGIFVWRKWWPSYVERRNVDDAARREHLAELRQLVADNVKVNSQMVATLSAVQRSVEEGNKETAGRQRYIEQAIVELRPVRPKKTNR